MVAEYKKYVKWINSTIMNLDDVKDWDELDNIRTTAQNKIQTKGQQQLHDTIWNTGNIEENRPHEIQIGGKWDELKRVEAEQIKKELNLQAQTELASRTTQQREEFLADTTPFIELTRKQIQAVNKEYKQKRKEWTALDKELEARAKEEGRTVRELKLGVTPLKEEKIPRQIIRRSEEVEALHRRNKQIEEEQERKAKEFEEWSDRIDQAQKEKEQADELARRAENTVRRARQKEKQTTIQEIDTTLDRINIPREKTIRKELQQVRTEPTETKAQEQRWNRTKKLLRTVRKRRTSRYRR